MKVISWALGLGAMLAVTVTIADAPVTVNQKGLQFSVTDLDVKKGQTVVFINDDHTTHNITVTGDGVNVNGGLQPPGAEFRMPFSKPGTYAVTCGIHPKMKLNIVVK
jgi:cytochrome c peroxidase